MAIELEKILEMPTNTLNEIREKISQLKVALNEYTVGTEEQKTAAEELIKVQQQQKAAMAGVAVESQGNVKSFNELNAELRRLKEEWKSTTDETRRNQLTVDVNNVKKQINDMNESIFNYQHNVGNYTNSIVSAFGQMGISVGKPVQMMSSMFGLLTGGLQKAMEAFQKLWVVIAANPVGALIAALGTLIVFWDDIKEALGNVETAQDRVTKATDDYITKLKDLQTEQERTLKLMRAMGYSEAEVAAQRVSNLKDQLGETTTKLEEQKAELERLNQWWVRIGRAVMNVLKYIMPVTEYTAEYFGMGGKVDGLKESVKKLTEEQKNLNNAVADAQVDEYVAITEADKKATEKTTEARKQATEAAKKYAEQQKKLAEEHQKYIDDLVKKEEERVDAVIDADIKGMQKAFEIQREAELAGRSAVQRENDDYNLRKRALKKYGLSTEALEKQHQLNLAEIRNKAAQEALDFEYQMEDRRAKIRRGEVFDEGGTGIDRAMQEAAEADADLDRFKTTAEEKIRLNEELMARLQKGSDEWTALDNQNTELRMQMAEKEAVANSKHQKSAKLLLEARYAAYQSMAKGTAGILKDLSAAMGENTKMGKGFAIASATIDTIASAVSGFRAGYNQWKDAGPMAWMAPVQAAINATAALVAGYAQVQKIASVDTSGNAQASGGGATALAIPNIEGLSSPIDYTRQVTTETEREQMNQENRVYILESDIQQSNNRVRVREEETTF